MPKPSESEDAKVFSISMTCIFHLCSFLSFIQTWLKFFGIKTIPHIDHRLCMNIKNESIVLAVHRKQWNQQSTAHGIHIVDKNISITLVEKFYTNIGGICK